MFSKIFGTKTNRYLAWTILILASLSLIELLIISKAFDNSVPFHFFSLINWELLAAATCLTYFIRVFKYPFISKRLINLFYLPFTIHFIVMTTLWIGYNFSLYTIPFSDEDPRFSQFLTAQYYFVQGFLVLCTVAIYLIIRKVKKQNVVLVDIKWTTKLYYFIAFIAISSVVVTFIFDFYDIDLFVYLYTVVAILFFWMSYYGVHQFRLVQERKEIHELLAQKQTVKPIEKTTKFSSDNSYFVALEQLMLEEKIYQNPDLSRDVVAEKLGISSGYLSQLINTITGQKFTDYVNAFRIEEVKDMLQNSDLDKYSLLAIGAEAGFKSKSAFYAIFKNNTGCTPGVYKKQLSKS